MKTTLIHGDCLEKMAEMESDSMDAIITDPPYGLGLMGKKWDNLPPDQEVSEAMLRVLKPAHYALVFGGTRTWHRLAVALEDAGFEMRDTIMYLYGTGFPKGKGNLKPAWEPIILCRKPGPRVRKLGIDECRISTTEEERDWMRATTHPNGTKAGNSGGSINWGDRGAFEPSPAGRYPANLVLDEEAGEMLDAEAGAKGGGYGTENRAESKGRYGDFSGATQGRIVGYGDSGGPSRFFYCAKASKKDRGEGNNHPTVKPSSLMCWLTRLVTPKDGIVLDPFMGSGTTGIAAIQEGRNFIGIELEEEYMEIARTRIEHASEVQELPLTYNGS